MKSIIVRSTLSTLSLEVPPSDSNILVNNKFDNCHIKSIINGNLLETTATPVDSTRRMQVTIIQGENKSKFGSQGLTNLTFSTPLTWNGEQKIDPSKPIEILIDFNPLEHRGETGVMLLR